MDGKMEELVIYGVPEWTARRQIVEIPKPGPKEVLIKVFAAGLNPKDWKYTEDCNESEALNAGDDLAGIIEAVGSDVFEYKPGDRVAGFHRLGEPSGGYAPYALALASTTFLLPPAVSFEAGATLPLASMTAAIALFQALRLPAPDTSTPGVKDIPVLIYGGATAVGGFALQLAKLCGLSPIITVAGAGIDFVKALDAATHIIDYHAGNAEYIQAEITAALGGKKLLHALDCAGGRDSWVAAGGVLAPGGQLNMLDWGEVLDWEPALDIPGPKAWTPPVRVELSFTLVSSAYGSKHAWISEERAAADADFAYTFYRYIARLLDEGRLRPHPHEVRPGGLDGILQGVKDLQAGKVSARKLVVKYVE
ncbi:GroES-like protein [Acephala macrosclerotiorum]|nr:GroES-like protein [Acephala macrosclerotiorum]